MSFYSSFLGKAPSNDRPKDHNLSVFRRKISALEQDVLRMGALVEQSCRLSHNALFDRDLTAVARIVETDDQIDRYYRQIEIDCANLMSISSPAAQDLRLLNAFIQMVRDLERIGDYAEELGEFAVKLLPYPKQPSMADLEIMSHKTRTMLAKSLIAISNLDGEAQSTIEKIDDEVDAAYDRVYRQLADQKDFRGNLEPILLLALSVRTLERMADHANNLARRVHYIVTGQYQ